MKNFCLAHFWTRFWNLPVISLLLFAGLAVNIKCSLLLQLKTQQPIPRSNPDINCWVISCLSDRSSPKCLLSHQNNYFFLSVSEVIKSLFHHEVDFCPAENPAQVIDCQTPIYTHEENVNNSAQLIKQIPFYLFISIYQTYPILFSSSNSVNSSLHILCK